MASALRVELRGREVLASYDQLIAALAPEKSPLIVTRTLKRVGDRARTQVIKALALQSGLKQKTIRKAVRTRPPNFRDFSYEMRVRGGNIALKYFAPREKSGGVAAKPRGRLKLFPGAFLKSGFRVRTPSRKLGGHVFQRVAAARLPIFKVRSDVYLPDELVAGATLDAFNAAVDQHLEAEFERQIDFATKGGFRAFGR